MKGIFITGTDTGVGKTYVSALLLRHLRGRCGLDAVGFKPICCGGREDAEVLHEASGGAAVLSLNEVNPVWLRTPAAPYTAAMIEGRAVDLALVRETFAALRARHEFVLVEGVGGWLVPIAHGYAVAHLAAELGLPVAVVVRNRLGALNHAALTVAHLRAHGQACVGSIFNHGPAEAPGGMDAETVARATNRAMGEEILMLPTLAEIEPNQGEWPGGVDSLWLRVGSSTAEVPGSFLSK